MKDVLIFAAIFLAWLILVPLVRGVAIGLRDAWHEFRREEVN
jgi:hypothetical protein